MDSRLYKCTRCGWFAAPPRGFSGCCPKCGGRVFVMTCSRCGHTWEPREDVAVKAPRVCPKCKSPYWNRPRKRGQKVIE